MLVSAHAATCSGSAVPASQRPKQESDEDMARRLQVEEDRPLSKAATEPPTGLGIPFCDWSGGAQQQAVSCHEVDATMGGRLCKKGITMRGALISAAILHGVKCIENRPWKIPPGWYALHTGSGALEPQSEHRLRQLWPDAPEEKRLPHGVIVGAFHVCEHREASECGGSPWATGKVHRSTAIFHPLRPEP